MRNRDNKPEVVCRATYFDIDLNAHVTTTRYTDWMMDTFRERTPPWEYRLF